MRDSSGTGDNAAKGASLCHPRRAILQGEGLAIGCGRATLLVERDTPRSAPAYRIRQDGVRLNVSRKQKLARVAIAVMGVVPYG